MERYQILDAKCYAGKKADVLEAAKVREPNREVAFQYLAVMSSAGKSPPGPYDFAFQLKPTHPLPVTPVSYTLIQL